MHGRQLPHAVVEPPIELGRLSCREADCHRVERLRVDLREVERQMFWLGGRRSGQERRQQGEEEGRAGAPQDARFSLRPDVREPHRRVPSEGDRRRAVL
jgi:hypothetical protein